MALFGFMFRHAWWIYEPQTDWYAQPYHWINLVESTAWLTFAALVLIRYTRHRHSRIELLYAFTFLTFGLSDFREAYVVRTWLIVFIKMTNFVALLYLRTMVIKRYYPSNRIFN